MSSWRTRPGRWKTPPAHVAVSGELYRDLLAVADAAWRFTEISASLDAGAAGVTDEQREARAFETLRAAAARVRDRRE